MAYENSAYPDQTAPEGAIWSGSTLFAIPLSILRNNCITSKIWAKEAWNEIFKILGPLPYTHTCSHIHAKENFLGDLTINWWFWFRFYLNLYLGHQISFSSSRFFGKKDCAWNYPNQIFILTSKFIPITFIHPLQGLPHVRFLTLVYSFTNGDAPTF